MKVNPITTPQNTFKVPAVKGKNGNMNKSFDRNFNNVRRENRKMNGSGGRR